MYSHLTVGTNDVEKARQFYDAIFGALGAEPGNYDAEKGRVGYGHKGGRFLVTKPINGEPATHANGGTIGFSVDSPEQAAAWHAAGLANGGTTCEDPPGIRDLPFGKMYLAYLRDPDGNKLCTVFWY